MLDILKSPHLKRYRDLPLEPSVTETSVHSPHPVSQHWATGLKKVRDRMSRVFDGSDFEITPEHDPEIMYLQAELQQSKDAHQRLMDEGQELDEGIREKKEELGQMEQRRKMSDETMKQLTLAQRFLSTADSLSQAEVVRAMETINEEVFQLASVVADTIQVKQKNIVHPKMREKYLLQVSSVLGPGFLDIVEPKVLEDILAIQLGWQAILVDWCSKVIMVWLAGEGLYQFNNHLHAEYHRVVNKNEQAVAGRWRAILRAAIETISPADRERLIWEVVERLCALPVLCGYVATSEVYESLWNTFYQRLGPLLDKCLELRKVLGEGVISTDIRTYLVDSSHKYSSRYMDLEYEDEEGDARAYKQDMVACTLSLGLFRSKRSRDGDGQFLNVEEMVLKPKVILQSTLSEIIS